MISFHFEFIRESISVAMCVINILSIFLSWLIYLSIHDKTRLETLTRAQTSTKAQQSPSKTTFNAKSTLRYATNLTHSYKSVN